MTINEAVNRSKLFLIQFITVGAMLLICALGIIVLSVLRDPIPPELTALAASAFAYLTGSVVTAGQIKS